MVSPIEFSSSSPSAASDAADDSAGNKRSADNEHKTKAIVRSKRKRQSNPNPLSVKKKRKREVFRIDA